MTLVSPAAEARRARQLAFLASGQDIEVGNPAHLPLPLEQLCATTPDSPWVAQYFGGGLTAEVFRIDVEGRRYTLKKKRARILVQNPDGQTSFLNEVQRRRDFTALKAGDPAGYAGIVDTVYASLAHGIILSPWIEGTEIEVFDRRTLDSIFHTLIQMALGGVFECDPTNGNLLIDAAGQVHLYDFGYAYAFDPCQDFNSDGTALPVFHCAERFETRAFMIHLLDIDAEIGRPAALALYRIEKEVALHHYQRMLAALTARHASTAVQHFIQHHIDLWHEGLRDDASLERLFTLEAFRSCLLDVHDDVSGQSANPDTLRKADHVIAAVRDHYAFIRDRQGFFWGDEACSREALLARYESLKGQARACQLAHLDGFLQWRSRRIANVRQHYR